MTAEWFREGEIGLGDIPFTTEQELAVAHLALDAALTALDEVDTSNYRTVRELETKAFGLADELNERGEGRSLKEYADVARAAGIAV